MSRRPTGIQASLAIVVTLIVALLIGGVVWMAATINTQADEGRDRQASLDALVHQYAQLYADAQDAGVDSSAPTPAKAAEGNLSGVIGDRGPMGPASQVPGPIGPTGIQGLAGNTGSTGADGLAGVDGKDGKDGADGADSIASGPPGRGIASGPTCLDDGSWLITYTDATTATTPGPCRIVTPLPDPTTTP